jgi:hypothetical protein
MTDEQWIMSNNGISTLTGGHYQLFIAHYSLKSPALGSEPGFRVLCVLLILRQKHKNKSLASALRRSALGANRMMAMMNCFWA